MTEVTHWLISYISGMNTSDYFVLCMQWMSGWMNVFFKEECLLFYFVLDEWMIKKALIWIDRWMDFDVNDWMNDNERNEWIVKMKMNDNNNLNKVISKWMGEWMYYLPAGISVFFNVGWMNV